jgi:hypothetical protein
MNDNEIVKELEKLIEELDDGYTTCIEHGGKRDLTIERDLSLYRDVLDLINRQREEIDRLHKEIDEKEDSVADLVAYYESLVEDWVGEGDDK